MTVPQHKIMKWLGPVGAILLAIVLAFQLGKAGLIESEFASQIVMFSGIGIGLVSFLVLQRVPVLCPQCSHPVEYYEKAHSALPRYSCEQCHFQSR